MRTYYLFIIKSEFYHTYLKNPISLYKTLENLYRFSLRDQKFGLTLYHQLCEMHNVSLLKNYFDQKKFRIYKKSYVLIDSEKKEKTLLQVKPSALVVTTNKNIPNIFKLLYYYNQYIFVCDFNNKDFFWLSNQYRKKHSFK